MFTLTTGCSHVWLVNRRRYLSGAEALLLHGVPVNEEIARVMKVSPVRVNMVSHANRCFLAGNSMHCANVGVFVAFALLYTELRG